ncbi:MAG: hypothetical protein AMXMBFR58_20760 [Phycisphaerae bacterium]|nr:hypothetical protein [Phycisphaerales bacterium]MCK6476267.1 cation transporter [Phycisphaerales bacterium]
MRTELLIFGMRSNTCREQVTDVLCAIHGVDEVVVSLVRSTAVVVHDAACAGSDLVGAVTGAGFGAVIGAGGGGHGS